MKPILLFLCVASLFLNTTAQQSVNKERFAFVSIYFDDVYKIKIDSGQTAITKKAVFVNDNTGAPLKFVSSAAALNHIATIGWKLQQVLQIIENTYGGNRSYIVTSYLYLFKRDD